MTASVEDVRLMLNIPDAGDLSDDVISMALERSEARVEAMKRDGAPDALLLDAVRALAAFYAYQTYSDRVVHKLEGAYDEMGHWSPVASVRIRETRDKLSSLRKDARDSLRLIKVRRGRLV
ncbi:MAG: hypothetical protein ACXQT2_01425 [Methanotrichaceae archaeon]